MAAKRIHTKNSFLTALGVYPNDIICFIGAGGKTSLMFRLAKEAKEQGLKVLVTTSTKILVPDNSQYDSIDLSGELAFAEAVEHPGIYVGGVPSGVAGKMSGVSMDRLFFCRNNFDLLLIEADGAAKKPLKGWKSSEPVIPPFATKTVGVLDIQTVGATISDSLVHRLEIFSEITGGNRGEQVTTDHLCRLVLKNKGLFSRSQGAKVLYINKVESNTDHNNAKKIKEGLELLTVVAGSLLKGVVHV